MFILGLDCVSIAARSSGQCRREALPEDHGLVGCNSVYFGEGSLSVKYDTRIIS
jgi:hypothetical protein